MQLSSGAPRPLGRGGMLNSARERSPPRRRRAVVSARGGQPAFLERLGVDLEARHRAPTNARVGVAALAAVVASLGADAGLVALGTAVFPATRGFSHFRPLDYGSFTVLGVLAACLLWLALVRVADEPRRLYRRLAVAVSLVLLLPDAYLLLFSGEPPRAVGVLVAMHGAVALCTYHLVVRLAPVPARPAAPLSGPAAKPGAREAVFRRWWFVALGAATGVEMVAGFVALLAVPFGRPSGLVVQGRGAATYLLHAVLGLAVAAGAVACAAACRHTERKVRAGAFGGLAGVVLGGLGGALVVDRPARLIGVGLMLVGAVVAPTAYLLPLMTEPTPEPGADPAATFGQAGTERG